MVSNGVSNNNAQAATRNSGHAGRMLQTGQPPLRVLKIIHQDDENPGQQRLGHRQQRPGQR
jgi:hypothetical protein